MIGAQEAAGVIAQLAVLPRIDRRLAPRRFVNIAAALRQPGAMASSVNILDVSSEGCKLQTSIPVEVGDEIWVKFEGLEARRCDVAWCDGEYLGCQFGVPLYPEELEVVAQRHQPLLSKVPLNRF